MLTFDEIRKSGYLLFEYIRGSQAYGTSRETSDIDTGGVFMEPEDVLYGLGIDWADEIESPKNDHTWYSFKKYMNLLLKSNPTALESLFVPQRCILHEHPVFTELRKNRDIFISQACFKPFMGYSSEQMRKARSLNKKVVQPMPKKKLSVLDFVFYRYRQGSKSIKNFLRENGLYQECCGLVFVERMVSVYSLYYDWGSHIYNKLGIHSYQEFLDYCKKSVGQDPFITLMFRHVLGHLNFEESDVKKLYDKYGKPLGYKGIVSKGETSNEVRLSPVLKDEVAILDVSYWQNGYTTWCKQYKAYWEWDKIKNNERFQEVLDHRGYDAKNMMHCMRLLNMGIEIASGKGFNVDRTGIDADYLLKIRTGQYTYDEIIKVLEKKDVEMKEVMNNTKLPESIDIDRVNKLMIELRKRFYL